LRRNTSIKRRKKNKIETMSSYDSDCAEEDTIEEGTSLVLVPRSTFCNEQNQNITENAIGVYLIEVSFGYVDKKNRYGEWYEQGVLKVKYTHGVNEEVNIPIIPELSIVCHIAYRFKFAPRSMRGGEQFQTDIQFVNLDHFNPLEESHAKFVRLPVENYAPHPWTDAKYLIRVHNYSTEENFQNPTLPSTAIFPGKIKYIWYGFTEASEEEYLSRNTEIPWQNCFEEFREEGVVNVMNEQHHHQQIGNDSNSGKGFFMMREIWIRLPDSKLNLVWKIAFDKFDGKGWEPSVYQGYHETQTFYYKKEKKI